MNKPTLLKTAAALLLCWMAPDAFAQDQCKVDPNAVNAPGMLTVARGKDCFGGDADTDPLSKKIVAIKKCKPEGNDDPTKVPLEIRWQLVKASREVEAASGTLATRASPEWASIADTLNRELKRSTTSLEDVDELSAAMYWVWDDHEALQQANGEFQINYGPLLDSKCPAAGGGGAECAKALATAIEVNRYVNLTRRLHQCAGDERLTQVRKRLEELDTAWTNYFFHTRSQFIWELGINSARFKGKDDVFAEPPKDQLIIAHPGVILEYVGGGAQNDEAYEAILMAELIGYNRFDWGKDSKLPPLGISIVGTYSPDNDGKHFGYGLTIHVNNVYSFGVGRRDTGAGDETVYLLSADLMKLFLKPSQFSVEKFRGAGTPEVREK